MILLFYYYARRSAIAMLKFDKRNEYMYMNLMNKNSHIYLTQFGRTIPMKEYCEKKRGLSRYLFDYVIFGSGYVIYKDKTYIVESGDMIFMRKGIDVDYGTDQNDLYEKFWFAIDGAAVGALVDCYLLGEDVMIIKNSEIELFQKIKNIVTAVAVDERLITHALLDVLMAFCEVPECGKNDIEDKRALAPRIKNYIDSRVSERFSLDNAVGHLHVSKRHIIRVFKEKYGVTPGAYHNEQRLIVAAHYLTDTTYTIGEIASVLGFCDQSFFSAAFKKHFGIYPLAYRNGNYNSIIAPSPNE